MNPEAEIVLKLVLAAAVGAVFGFDREKRLMPAGFRTYTLVGVGSCLAMMTNLYLYAQYANTDVARIGAAVVTGIGFLCAGSIIVTKMNRVRGLTTSAALWACGCIGLAIGCGFYFAAAVAAVISYLFLIAFRIADKNFRLKSCEMDVFLEVEGLSDMKMFFEFADSHKILTKDLDITKSAVGERSSGCVVTLILPKGMTHDEALALMSAVKGISYVRDIT